MLPHTWFLRVVAAAVLSAGCGPPATGAASGAGGSGILRGVPGDCQLLEAWDADLHGRLLGTIDDGVAHGPLVVAGIGRQTVIASTTYKQPGVEGGSAAWMAEDGDVVALNVEAARISSAKADVIDSAGENPLAATMAQAQDCSLVAADRAAPDPPQPEPAMRPDLMIVEPAVAEPGQQLALRFPKETPRGIAFELHRRTDMGWEVTHLMNSDANGAEYAQTVPVGTDGFGSIDVGIGGPGPDRVALPNDIQAGEYRVCTANAGDEFCAPLSVAPR